MKKPSRATVTRKVRAEAKKNKRFDKSYLRSLLSKWQRILLEI